MKLFRFFPMICFITRIWSIDVITPTQLGASLGSMHLEVAGNNPDGTLYGNPKGLYQPMIHSDDTILIGVMGPTGSGKTTFINLASGSNLRVGQELDSCTETVETSEPFELDGRRVVLVDTPGFDDTSKSDGDILRAITQYLVASYETGKTMAGILYFHRISDNKVAGISRRNFDVFCKLCGNSTLGNVAIVTNMWENVDPKVGERGLHQLATDDRFFGPAIGAGATLLSHNNTMESTRSTLRHIIGNHPLPLLIQREIVDEHLNFNDTAAVTVLYRDLKAKEQEHQRQMEATRREIEAANEEEKKRLRQELEEQEVREKKAREERERVERGFEGERKRMREERERIEREWREVERERRRRRRGLFERIGEAIDDIFG